MKRIKIAVSAIFVVALLTACGAEGYGESNQDRKDRLYSECISAGGSFTTNDTDFSCIIPCKN